MTGQTNLAAIGVALETMPQVNLTALLFGVALVLVALGFKVAAVPFQFWVPDVYQGAPTPITAFLSVGSKAAGFVVLLRVLEPFYVLPAVQAKLVAVLAIMAGATLVYGNLAAMPQTNFKRLLAYSSIGHAGYLLMGVASVGAVMAGAAISFYLVAYLFTTMLAFLVLVIASKAIGGDDIAHFNGLAKRAPWLAAAMLLAMLSLAGIPFTAGFLGKLFIFQAALAEGHFVLVVIGVITVAAGFYYYLKIARAMYWQAPPEGAGVVESSAAAKVAMVVMAVAIFLLGVYPQPILGLFE
jgi:NADH-quinone oxidoreductase subunit N